MTRPRQKFSAEELDKLKDCAKSSVDQLARVRCRAVYLYGSNRPVNEILEEAGCSRTVLMEWCRKYRQSGLEGLLDHRQGGNSARLSSAQLADLKQRLHRSTRNPQGWTVEALEQVVQDWYGVRYKSRTSYHNLFRKCGFGYDREIKAFRPANRINNL